MGVDERQRQRSDLVKGDEPPVLKRVGRLAGRNAGLGESGGSLRPHENLMTQAGGEIAGDHLTHARPCCCIDICAQSAAKPFRLHCEPNPFGSIMRDLRLSPHTRVQFCTAATVTKFTTKYAIGEITDL